MEVDRISILIKICGIMSPERRWGTAVYRTETVSSYKCTLFLGNQLEFCSLTGHSADCATESLLVAKSLERTQSPLCHFLFLHVGSVHLSTSYPLVF